MAISNLGQVDKASSSLVNGQICTHYTKDSNVDRRHDNSRSPFQPSYNILCLADDGYPVDDNLHKNLDLENPTKQDEEQHSDAGDRVLAG